jgi:hypothetical protein
VVPDLQPRQPGGSLPEPVRNAAVQAGRQRRPVDPFLLRRVRDALAGLPENVMTRHNFAGEDSLVSGSQAGSGSVCARPGMLREAAHD